MPASGNKKLRIELITGGVLKIPKNNISKISIPRVPVNGRHQNLDLFMDDVSSCIGKFFKKK